MELLGRQVSSFRREIRRKKVEQFLPPKMRQEGIDMWLLFTREGAVDPIGMDISTGGVVGRTASIFGFRKGRFEKVCIAASYDVTPIIDSKLYDRVIPHRKEGVGPHLRREIKKFSPGRVALNFSRDMPNCDGLTHGNYLYLLEMLGEGFADKVVSAEDLIVSFRGRKLPEEIEAIETATVNTQEILAETLTAKHVKPGKTREVDVRDVLFEKTKNRGFAVSFVMVMVGPDRGHSSPTELVIRHGDLLRIDFGIINDEYHSDIQRTAYILKPGEKAAPARVQKLFDDTLKANRAAIAAMKPGIKAVEVDATARRFITEAGYEEYHHAAGHEIGLAVHDVGPILGPNWKERYGSSVMHPLETGQVFAVEPMIYENIPELGGVVQVGLEEDVVVEDGGARIMGKPQEKLILIGA
jgi:Xaa-Pro dipeptidase